MWKVACLWNLPLVYPCALTLQGGFLVKDFVADVIMEADFTDVSRVRASSFPVKAEISSSYLIYTDQRSGLRHFYSTFVRPSAFQLTKCAD